MPNDSRQLINSWVSDRTSNKIEDLLPAGSVKSTTRFVLTNAVYFNAAWKTKFEPSATKPAAFFRPDGSTVTVQRMSVNQPLSFGQGKDYTCVELPYDGGALSMAVILPPQGTLDAFEASLTPDKVASIVAGLGRIPVALGLPRFRIEASFSLEDQLSALGMPDAFTSAADFSGVDGQRDLVVGAVMHKAFVDVSESGAEAAAATAVEGHAEFVPSSLVMTVDHPFLFLIRDVKTGTILFFGRVEDPSN